jgi:hypothetical protein
MVAGSGWLRGGLLRAGLRGGRACAAPPKPNTGIAGEPELRKSEQPERVSQPAKTAKPPPSPPDPCDETRTSNASDISLDDQSLVNLDWYGIQVGSAEMETNASALTRSWPSRHSDVNSHICEMSHSSGTSSCPEGEISATRLSVFSSSQNGGKRPQGLHGESSEEEESKGVRKRIKRKRWSQEEESMLMAAVTKHGTDNWRMVAKVTCHKDL